MMKPFAWTLADALKARLDGSADPFTLHITTMGGGTGEYTLVVLGADCMEVRYLGGPGDWQNDVIFLRYDAIALVRIQETGGYGFHS